MFTRLFFRPKVTITNADIKNMTIDTIKSLKQKPNNEFQLTCTAMQQAYDMDDMDKLKYLHDTFDLQLPTLGGLHVDSAIEEGNTDRAKFLVNNFGYQPSLYAIQMAEINGHHDLANWVNENSTLRNNFGIQNVHSRFDKNNGGWVWDNWVPEAYRVRY